MVIPRPDADVPMPIPLVFFGSPPFAVPTLTALAMDARYDVRLVITQPPRPSGRGRQVHRSAVHEAADARGLPVLAPERLRDPAVGAQLVAVAPSVFVVVVTFAVVVRTRSLEMPPPSGMSPTAPIVKAKCETGTMTSVGSRSSAKP